MTNCAEEARWRAHVAAQNLDYEEYDRNCNENTLAQERVFEERQNRVANTKTATAVARPQVGGFIDLEQEKEKEAQEQESKKASKDKKKKKKKNKEDESPEKGKKKKDVAESSIGVTIFTTGVETPRKKSSKDVRGSTISMSLKYVKVL